MTNESFLWDATLEFGGPSQGWRELGRCTARSCALERMFDTSGYWGEGYGSSSPVNIRDLWERMLGFLQAQGVAP